MASRTAEFTVPTLPRERLELLTELAVALQKTAIYPVTHPLLAHSIARLEERLTAELGAGGALTLGVARDRILVDGVPAGEDRPLVTELARKLYRQQIAAVRVSAGVTREELANLLAAITDDGADDERPLGLRGPEALQRWEHVRLQPLTFEQLELVEGDASDEGATADESHDESGLWMGLVQASLASPDDAAPADPDEVARRLDAPDWARDRAVAEQMRNIVDKLERATGAHSDRLRRRLSRIVRGMHPQTLQRILSVHGDDRMRADFASRAANVLAADAVVDVVQAVATVSGQTISHSFLRLLKKMAAHAEEAPAGEERTQADGQLRAQVQQLLGSWQLADPNPDEYTRALESIAATRSMLPEPAGGSAMASLTTPERVLQLSLEVGVVGPPTLRALDALRQREDQLPLLEIIAGAPAGSAQDELESFVTSPRLLRRLLGRGNVPQLVLSRIATRLGPLAIEPLLEEYVGGDEPSAEIASLLVSLGQGVGDAVVAELERARPSEQRRLLLLLDRLPEWPTSFTPVTLARSPDAALRREAVKLMLRREAYREEAMLLGLDDPDERVLGIALGAALKHARPSLAPLLLRRLEETTHGPDVRALLVRALAATRDEDSMRWLVRITLRKVWVVGGARLREKTPEMLAALEGLATHWAHAVEAAVPLAMAARSTDPEIRATVERIRAS